MREVSVSQAVRFAALLLLTGCAAQNRPQPIDHTPRLQRSLFGTTHEGVPVERYVLTNAHGLRATIITYGAAIASLSVPDRDGRMADVVLGYDSLPQYLTDARRLGAVVGRYANRIGQARFTIDGATYALAKNNGPHNLHGGPRGLYKVVWTGAPIEAADRSGVVLTYTSPDGDQGFPGALSVRVTYTLTDRDELMVDYHATTDRPTPVNFTQHTYFNLTGDPRRDILGHVVSIDADSFTPVDSTQLPTGAILPLTGTPLEFRRPTALGARIDADDPQLRWGRGYDHNFVLRRQGSGLVHAARVVEPSSGRTLDVYTTEPGLQLYTANALDGSIHGKGGVVYGRRSAVCLETQHFADSPNQPSFPNTILRPGSAFESRTVFAFGRD
jgi:aldose 1-epimerase